MLQLIFQNRGKSGRLDLEAIEMAMRSAMHQAGAAALSRLLQCHPPAIDQRERACPCGQTARYRELRSRRILTVLGEVEIVRPYYLCASCGKGQFPFDGELDVEKTDLSPGVRRMLALVGSESPFDHGRQQMEMLAGLEVTTKAVERTAESVGEDIARHHQRNVERAIQLDLPIVMGEAIPILYVQMDGTGIPVVKKETEGRPGKVDGQPAHTREVKLGCVFTQTKWDEQGYAIRDPASTTYTGAIEISTEFGKRIYLEAWNRGWSRAEKKVVIADGAEWIWNLADQHFPGVIQIVDLYHARQHLWNLARLLHPGDCGRQKQWIMRHQPKLDGGKIDKLVRFLRSIHAPTPALGGKIQIEASYFERNAERMRYPQFRRQHLFVGSGVIEAGCKTVIGSRLKQSGMFWTVRGANAIIALRCCCLNGDFENYWETRAAA
ncbi:MAG: ISKra4 family transposase [Acidobacteriota bacterium]|nr:ISKra4 family transposase [Acidobacteriota bacterium]